MDSDDDEFMYFEDESSDPEDDQYDDIDITYEPEGDTGEPSVKRHMKDDDEFYDCLTPESIVVTMTKCIDEVNSVFEIPAATARILLTHFKWDKEKLLERYYTGDQDALFKEAHVVNPHRDGCSSSTLRKTKSTSSTSSSSCLLNQSTCEICIRALSISDLTGLECGHVFCQECWDEYLKNKIMVENTGQNIFCPATECDILVHENFVLSVVKDVNIRSRYHKLIADSFVQSNCLMKWCPAPNCNNAIKAIYNEAKPVTCLCGFIFCFGCTQPSHDPVKCIWLKKWLKKCDDDSETSNWLSANTKECPKCHVTIEKNGGCNHMVCKSSHCKMDFCWVCLGPWESHGSSWYNCNRYDEEDAQAARDAQAKSRAALERYLFYCNRYMNHLQSARFEQKLYDQVKETMEVLQKMNMSWIEVQFLRKAVDVLSVCRNTLKYTYVFAFYLKKNNQSIIFEDNQKDLEMVTEQLSEYLERDINTNEMNDVQEMKQKVHDKYRYCEQRRIVLLDHVVQGYEDDFWEYQDDI